MSWIKLIDYTSSQGKLRKLYNRIKTPDNYIDNIMLVHGLRPNTLEGHMSIYKNALHSMSNTTPKWLLEAIGVYVSNLNNCEYCVNHHLVGMSKGPSEEEFEIMKQAILKDLPSIHFSGLELLFFRYAKQLTLNPSSINESMLNELRQAGSNDGQILEINQVVAYFNYANRTVLGLGVNNENEVIGLSPGDNSDSDNWQHE